MKPGDLVRITQIVRTHEGFPAIPEYKEHDLGLGILLKKWKMPYDFVNDKRKNQTPIWEVLRGEVTDICSESALELISGKTKEKNLTPTKNMV